MDSDALHHHMNQCRMGPGVLRMKRKSKEKEDEDEKRERRETNEKSRRVLQQNCPDQSYH